MTKKERQKIIEAINCFLDNDPGLTISLVCLVAAVVGILFMGCAGTPFKKVEAFTADRVTFFCAPPEFIKQQFAQMGGDPKYHDTVYAFAEPRFNHVYTPCVEIDGMLLPEDMAAFGHEVFHRFVFKYPDRLMNPDDWRVR